MALRVAAGLVSRFTAQLSVLHAEAIEAPPYFTPQQIAVIERERRAARAQATRFVRQFAERNGALPGVVQIVESAPAEAIVREAAKAHLVVMGTHGRHGPRLWWMGSVAERVSHESPTPVLVVRADAEVSPQEMFNRPLVVADGSGAAADAVGIANGLADAFGGAVREPIARCETDLASQRSATSIVVARAGDRDGGFDGAAVERWLRRCTLPMLFVPSAGGALSSMHLKARGTSGISSHWP